MQGKWSDGGANPMRQGDRVDLYSREEGKRVRMNDEAVTVRPLLSPKLKLDKDQRAVGSAYGAMCELIGGSGGPQIRERVDSSGTGQNLAQVLHWNAYVTSAREAMKRMGPISYPLGPSRGEGRSGRHVGVRARYLVDAICIEGFTLETVCIQHGWIVEQVRGGRLRTVVPDRQRKHLAEGLRKSLTGILEEWDAKRLEVPGWAYGPEVEQ